MKHDRKIILTEQKLRKKADGSVKPSAQKEPPQPPCWEDLRISNDFLFGKVMQVKTTNDIPKRSRYYQSIIDLQWLDKGENTYKNLNKTYIIFICLSDLFHKGRHIYTFENICKEDHRIVMGDESVKIILNAKGTRDDVSQELKAFLDYVAGTKTENPFVDQIDQAVAKAKKNRE